ncbi:serine-rich adhesin for platelets isoform X2 [Athalia rosae]|uniref:serine-rich adhesin for platelets isoform X2 n=1 Tax=Athalia rosae TaxID=37344 RepID=UPI002033A046|nr:serine-rich adhesin for platelets isoform X2 [Athalia rosae]
MEGGDGPAAINKNPAAIKVAQEEMGKLDVLVCGQCHSVFHFIEEFQEHRSSEDACSKVSHFRENSNNEQKAQVWAFLLWKDSQIQQESTDRDTANSWKLYQKWCKMDTHIRDSWIAAGKTIQTFTKISNAKMQEVSVRQQTSVNTEGMKRMVVRKVIRNGQPDEIVEIKKEMTKPVETKTLIRTLEQIETEQDKKEPSKPKPSLKRKMRPAKLPGEEEGDTSDEEYVVERILAKRFNPKKKCYEYLLKWEGFALEHNTWEPSENMETCKHLLEEFERNLAKQKELKAAQQQAAALKPIVRQVGSGLKPLVKPEAGKPGPSTAAQVTKSKAMDQVKQWCGSMKDEDNDVLGKRRIAFSDSESDEGGSVNTKRMKTDTASDDDWTGDSEDDSMGRSDVIQQAFNRATAQPNGSNRTVVSGTDLATSLGLQSPEAPKSGQTPVLVANAKGVVKVDPKQMPNLTSGVYVMSRKDGIIKLDSSPSGKMGVKGSPGAQGVLMVQNRDGGSIVRKQVISANQPTSTITPVKVVSKPDGSQVVTQMKIVSKGASPKTGMTTVQKQEPIKIQPKPDVNQLQQIHVVTAVSSPMGLQPRISTGVRPMGTPQRGITRPLLARTPVRTNAPASILGSTLRAPVRVPAPKQLQTQQGTRQILQKRPSTGTIQSPSSGNSTGPGTTQMRPKYTVVSAQTKPLQKTIVSPVQAKQGVRPPLAKQQSLLSPQQKLLMAKKKAQEAAGIHKPARGLLAGARGTPGRGRGRVGDAASVTPGNKPKESKLAEGDGLHMEFHEVGSEESSSDGEPEPSLDSGPIPPIEPDSPPRPFTLCPLTGRIVGPDGEPVEQPTEQAEQPTPVMQQTTGDSGATVTAGGAETSNDGADATTSSTTELVLPSLDSLTEGNGIMRVEMSPGGTTGTIVQTSEAAQINLSNVAVAAPDLPCLDDSAPPAVTATTTSASTSLTESTLSVTETATITTSLTTSSTTTATTVASASVSADVIKTEDKLSEEKGMVEDTSSLVTITSEDGVVYQVAGQAEDGQTLLVTQGADGEQQCVYVTTEQQGDDGSVLTLDHAVAEAVAHLMPDQVNLTPQFYVKEGDAESSENQMVVSIMDSNNSAVAAGQEDSDGQAQVVAQVVQADDPTPGGTRRVVLLLPDGHLMMTEVDEEQYAALELDK